MPASHQYRERDYEFANTFLTLRTAIGLTQGSLAALLGVSRRAVENWEQGLTIPKAEHLSAFLDLCVRHAAFTAGHEEEQIRAFWKASRSKVLLDEYWLSELLAQAAPTPSGGAEQESAAAPENLALWTVPYLRNPHFTGRQELLSRLEQQLAPKVPEQSTTLHQAALTQAQAIKGLGGVGKTQTAIEYAYRAREQGRYTHTLWINAASEETVLASFAALAEWVPALGKQEKTDERALTNQALRWLEQRQDPWLIIYDNADEIAYLPAYLPTAGRGSLLFTTRAGAVRGLAPSLEVDALPVEEGVQLLLRRTGYEGEASEQEREEARAIVQALGGLPLALDQAGAYVEETGCSLQDYLHIYEQHHEALLARRGQQASGYPDSVATTWSLAFEQIAERDPAAAELLQLCAFVAPDQVPEELLTGGASHWPAALREAVTDRLRFNQVLSTLLAFSLIKRAGRERALSLHRLVQVVQRVRMTPEEQRQWAERFVRAVQDVFPRDPRDVASWPVYQRCLEQALACETLIEQQDLRFPEAAEVLYQAGVYLRVRGLYRQAEPLLRRALGIREQILGPEHPDVATLLHALASLYGEQGQYAQAEPLFQRALHIWEQSLGPEHPQLAPTLNNLANLYREQGQYVQAQPLFQRALRIGEQHLGPEHPQVALMLQGLASLYGEQGQYAQAELLYLRALRIWEVYLGPEHLQLAPTLNGLASLYTLQGQYTQAEPFYLRALRILEQVLGPEHLYVSYPLQGLADLNRELGQYTQAEQLYQRALRIWEEQPGAEHPDVAYALHGLALLAARQGRESEAEALFERALSICEQRRGEGHRETAEVLHAYANFRQAQGRSQEAAIMYQRALTTREQVLGPDHPLTLDTRARLQEVLVAPEQARETTQTEA